GNKIEQQFEATIIQHFAELLQCRVAPESVRNSIFGDGIRRRADILLAQAGQSLGILLWRMRFEGDRSGARAGCPNSHEPDVCEAQTLPLVEFSFRNIGQRDWPRILFRELRQPAASVNFVQKRMSHHHLGSDKSDESDWSDS